MLLKAENQPIDARVGNDAAWITDFITPNNPDVILKYRELTRGVVTPGDTAVALWHYVSHQPYVPLISARMSADGKTFKQKDTWFYPAESVHLGFGNCLAGDTKILTAKDGQFEIVRIEQLSDFYGRSVVSYNWEAGKVELKPIIAWFNNGKREVIKARFNNGESISATPNHILFHNGQELSFEQAISGGADLHNVRFIPPPRYSIKGQEIQGVFRAPVYDLEVADNHNFMLANGTLVHNCANKSFVLTSLLKNYFSAPGQVYCAVGNISLDGIGSHAWVELNNNGIPYILETTQPNISRALIPKYLASAYKGMVYFDQENVYTTDEKVSVAKVLSSHFGVCAIPFLETYLCERCLSL